MDKKIAYILVMVFAGLGIFSAYGLIKRVPIVLPGIVDEAKKMVEQKDEFDHRSMDLSLEPVIDVESGEWRLISPAPSRVPSLMPANSPSPASESINTLDRMIMPGSEVIGRGSSDIQLRNYGTSEKVVEWYENRLVELGMRSRSFVNTKVNQVTRAELSGMIGDERIRVKIDGVEGNLVIRVVVE